MFGRTTHAFVFSLDLLRQTAIGEAMRQSHFEVLSFAAPEALLTAAERLGAWGDVVVLDATEAVATIIPRLDEVGGICLAGALVGAPLPRRWAPALDAGPFWMLSYVKTPSGHPQVGLYLRHEDRQREAAGEPWAESDLPVMPAVPAEMLGTLGQPEGAPPKWLAAIRKQLNEGLLSEYESIEIEWTGEALVLSGQVLTRTRRRRAEQLVLDTGAPLPVVNQLDVI